LIVSTRATEGSIANLLAIDSKMTDSGLAQADAVAMAVAGKGAFAKTGPARHLRVIADLYGEAVHLVAAKDAHIANVGDLRGKRVSISTEGSGTILTARAILAAYRLNERNISANYDPADKATDLLQEGKIDAIFFVGGTPVNLIAQLIDEGVAALIPIDGAGRERLLAREPYLSAYIIPQGTYGSAPAVETVSVDALWITNDTQPDALVYAMVKALFNPANRSVLDAEKRGGHFFDPAAAANVRMPLHPGALRYFLETGLVKQPAEKAALPPASVPSKS
jgi:TRAP transporter TAXI family solute receptor